MHNTDCCKGIVMVGKFEETEGLFAERQGEVEGCKGQENKYLIE